ncbi:MAG: hypothetical protein EPO35_00870 [Acidobacteria bacterium]|nr:MAG: hypothetical protein EPO35_00870 [Acidobacteriota bacterium]
MSRRTLALTLVTLCLSASALAQQAAPAAPQRGTTPAPQGATAAPPAARPIDAGIDPTDANITIELTVVDKPAGSMTTSTRRGTITVANQNSGSVRGLSGWYNSTNRETKLDPLGLDVDARTTLRKSGMVSVTLTVAYVPAGTEPTLNSVQRQSATLFLKPGQETQVLTTGSMSDQGPAVRITAKATVNK